MTYCCRAHVLGWLYCYDLAAKGLARQGPGGKVEILFSDIVEILVFKERRLGSFRSYWACTIKGKSERYNLTSAHRVSWLRIEDRTKSYIPFIKKFEQLALTANPSIRFVEDEFRDSLYTKIVAALFVRVLAIASHLPRRQVTSAFGAIVRRIGPMLRAHGRARHQISAAFPELSRDDVRVVLQGMWDNFGRTFAEYAHVRELMRFSVGTPKAAQVVMDGHTAELVRSVGSQRQGALIFAAHLGNWEIPAMTARACGLDVAVLYKPQPSRAIANHLFAIRSLFAGRQIAAGPAAPREILKALRERWLVGMLVDQHYATGIEVSFLGHICRVNPLLARLARVNEYPVYGARVVRLADQRHRFELVGPLHFTKDEAGRIAVQPAMQTVFSVIEGWIREHPEQWIWIHRMLR